MQIWKVVDKSNLAIIGTATDTKTSFLLRDVCVGALSPQQSPTYCIPSHSKVTFGLTTNFSSETYRDALAGRIRNRKKGLRSFLF